MKINFCTYFDINYLSKFLTLKNSLNKFNFEYTFYILALDNLVIEFFKKNKFNNLKIIELDEIENKYELLKDVKKNRATIEYYFTLSPFLPKYIFEKEGINQITYLDSDFFFFQNPKKIISENIDSSVSLIKQNSKEKYGKFNVGWINFNFDYDETINIVNVWSNQCLNECSDIPKKNSYADQKYLDTWIAKLKYSRVFQPEYTCLSPWDTNIKLVNNTKKMISYHFHGLEIFENYFVSGFYRYNKKTNQKIIEEIYYPYIENLKSIEKKYNLKSSSIRQHRDKILSKFFIAIRTLKSNIKKFYYNDYHSYKV
jgi:hypothetical protein